ncbi:prolyl-tRNA synthetase [Chryseobacterium sp. GMJ5]|uniref:Prolyl-tRNA synthetase n=1 Tax=Chryseobacterium gilvum TaxID=2976534 RepID=A0ABT2VTD2_9FLAO|nr:prolyl-tRNA synthetase [Chryseobacterium gilvum]MCU7613246.1 prolyl-tRNA synthetase [Chryseobacterium gilvum]
MKKNIHKNLLGVLRSKGILAISSGLLLMSCGAQVGGYSETDGVYYDPNKDTLPEGVIINNDQGNRVGEYYDYYDDSNVIENAQANSAEQNNRYNSWNDVNLNNATDSDWGNFAGNQTNYYDNSWGSPWGWYGGYSPYWGMGSGWGMSMSFGWGNSWGWGGFSPYWSYGWNYGWNSPYYWGGYYPYWGGYNPYWGYGGGYWGNYYRPVYRRSGANGRGFTNNTVGINKYGNGSGFRNSNGAGTRNSNGGFRNSVSNGGFRQGTVNGGFRQGQGSMNGGFRNQPGGTRNPNYQQPRPNYNQQQSQPRPSDNGGFRSGGFNSGSGGGGFRSGGSSGGGGGMRSGGGGGFRSGGR